MEISEDHKEARPYIKLAIALVLNLRFQWPVDEAFDQAEKWLRRMEKEP